MDDAGGMPGGPLGPPKIQTFHWGDYLVFSASLLISIGIGVYFGIKGRKSRSLGGILMADGKLRIIPGSLSIIATFLSAIMILGMTAEVYMNGAMLLYISVSMVLTGPVIAFFLVPTFYRLRTFSVYEYLEKRFNGYVRTLGALAFCVQMIVTNAIVLYAPSLAFEKVLDIDFWWIIIGCGIICTFYTVIGGMKAVVWTDTFQVLVILGGLFTLVIRGCQEAGGIDEVWDAADASGRINFDSFSFDPRVRHTFWVLGLANIFGILGMIGTNQASVQRMNAMEDIDRARWSNVMIGFMILVPFVPLVLLGITMYAYYRKCQSPLITGAVDSPDQIVPHFMMDVIGNVHGLPGLFAASVFSASLSTFSSSINSLVAVVLEDLITPVRAAFGFKPMRQAQAINLTTVIGIAIGGVSILLAYCCKYMGSNLFQMSITLINITGAPLFALFFMGMFLPFINAWGALSGFLVSFGSVIWILYYAIDLGYTRPPSLPLTSVPCPLPPNVTLPTIPDMGDDDDEPGIYNLYRMSYQLYSLYVLVVCVIVAMIVTGLTLCKQKKVDKTYLFQWRDLRCCLKSREENTGPVKWRSHVQTDDHPEKQSQRF